MSSIARVRLIASDLDGTLLRNDGTLLARSRAALEAADARGVRIVAVTARPPRRVREVAARTGLRGVAICTNGALVYDLDSHRVVRQTRLLAGAVRALVVTLRREVPGVVFAVEVGAHHGCEASYRVPEEHGDDVIHAQRADDVIALCAEGVTKLIVQHPSHLVEPLLALVRSHAPDDLASITHSGSDFVEVGPAGVTKATALAEYCAELSIEAREVIAFGDMPNDLPMMQWAGWSVAVENAHPTLAAHVDEVTGSNEQDGVAAVLERLARTEYSRPEK